MEINQRRFRADAFVVSDLYEYCRQHIAERVVSILEQHLAGRLFTCGLQQPPLTLAAANFTQLHRHYDLERVDGVYARLSTAAQQLQILPKEQCDQVFYGRSAVRRLQIKSRAIHSLPKGFTGPALSLKLFCRARRETH